MIIEDQLFARHRGKNILLDTNLLLVFLTGEIGVQFFERFDRVSKYTIQDYELIVQILSSFRVLVTTPHILTEVSNLANKLSGSYRRDWYANLAAFVMSDEQEIGVRETWVPAKRLAALPEFLDFGITDSAVGELVSNALVVTDDFRLSGALRNKGIDVLNFKELRAMQDRIQ